MKGASRTPFTKASNQEAAFKDPYIEVVKKRLSNIKNKDFPLKRRFEEINAILTPIEQESLKLCKLLYCTGHRKEMFLHLGIILESRLNAIIALYKSMNWRTPNNFQTEEAMKKQFETFVKKSALSDKANYIDSSNLLNSSETSEQLKFKIQAFRSLRNYGGHTKSVVEFFELVIDSQPDCDDEIDSVFKFIKQLELAIQALIKNPPPTV